jgi:hypothetical protein
MKPGAARQTPASQAIILRAARTISSGHLNPRQELGKPVAIARWLSGAVRQMRLREGKFDLVAARAWRIRLDDTI